jgi:hypothetical protein
MGSNGPDIVLESATSDVVVVWTPDETVTPEGQREFYEGLFTQGLLDGYRVRFEDVGGKNALAAQDGLVPGYSQAPAASVLEFGQGLDAALNEQGERRYTQMAMDASSRADDNRNDAYSSAAQAQADYIRGEQDRIATEGAATLKEFSRNEEMRLYERSQDVAGFEIMQANARDADAQAAVARQMQTLARRTGEQAESYGLQLETLGNRQGDFDRGVSTSADPYRAINNSQVGSTSGLANYAKTVLDLDNNSQQEKLDIQQDTVDLNNQVAQNNIWDAQNDARAEAIRLDRLSDERNLAYINFGQDGLDALNAGWAFQDLQEGIAAQYDSVGTGTSTITGDMQFQQNPVNQAASGALAYAQQGHSDVGPTTSSYSQPTAAPSYSPTPYTAPASSSSGGGRSQGTYWDNLASQQSSSASQAAPSFGSAGFDYTFGGRNTGGAQ